MNSTTSLNRSLIIFAFDDAPYQKGFIQISQKYYEEVKRLFPEISQLQLSDISQAIGIWGPSKLDHKEALQLKVKAIFQNSNSLQIKFEKTGEVPLTSREIKSRARSVIRKSTSWNENGFLPLVCVFTSEQISQILDSRKLRDKELFSENNWAGIYELYQPIQNLSQKPEIWNDAEILSRIGFACGKLSDVGTLPVEILRDRRKKEEYLKQLAKYRQECTLLYKRCVELEPENPRHYSNLGYHYYSYAHQLKAPREREDFNETIFLALEYLDKALSFSSERLNDLYRKGYLLIRILPDKIQYGGYKDLKLSHDEARKQGIACLEKLIGCWEDWPENDDRKKRYRKEYIKSLHILGWAYYERVRNNWDEITILLQLKSTPPASEADLARDLAYAQKAWDYFYKCWQVDRPNPDLRLDESNLLETPSSGEVDGVYRLYWLGKVAFLQYWILSYYGMCNTEKALPFAEKSVKFLQAALRLSWSPKSGNQRRDFIVELLGRVYLALGEPQKAVQMFEKNFKNRPIRDAYIQNTYAMGLILTGCHEKAAEILEEAENNRSNLNRKMTVLLQGCNYLSAQSFNKARPPFETILEDKKNSPGKQVLAYAWVGLAFIAYHNQEITSAIEYLQRALELVPYHSGIRQKMIEWKQQNSKNDSTHKVLPAL